MALHWIDVLQFSLVETKIRRLHTYHNITMYENLYIAMILIVL